MTIFLRHNIPDFYFEAFCDANIGESLNSGARHVWITDRRLSSLWRRVSFDAFLTRLGNPEQSGPAIELTTTTVSDLATGYSSLIKKTETSSILDSEDRIKLSFLVLTLLTEAGTPNHKRKEEVIEANQFTWENFESAIAGAQAQANRTRSSLRLPEGDLLDHGMHFILNRTGYPFVTSDRAIFVDSWDSLEAKRTFGRLGVLDEDVSGTTERVIYLPLSPEAALVSSAFIKRGYASEPYIECAVEEEVFLLNLLACYSADPIIVSSKERPFGRFQLKAQSLLTS
ncbi:MAG TPA: DUF4238 domain-containing protein [Pyrinomonadaceae bacterium]|nr:DUF4238 domain-containing protein [Pyrinomonadaceae bacterium]